MEKKDILAIARALTAGQRLNKWERRKLVDKLQLATGIKLYDKTCTKEICQRKNKRAIGKDIEKEESPLDPRLDVGMKVGSTKPLLTTNHTLKNLQPILIVGCGEISDYYFNSLLMKPGYVVIGVVDVDAEKSKSFSSKVNAMQLQKYSNIVCVFGTSIAEVLKEQYLSFFKLYKCSKRTIAINLTPAEYHFEINKEILGEHKCHLFTEKPMADTVEHGSQLLELAQQNNLKLSVAPVTCMGESQRTMQYIVNERKDIFGVPKYGTCNLFCGSMYPYDFRMNLWKKHRRYKIGSMIDVGVYPLTLLTGIFGEAIAVSCWGKGLSSNSLTSQDDSTDQNLDLYTMHLEFRNGFSFVLTTTLSLSETSDKASNLELHGTKGKLKLRNVWSFDSQLTFVGDGGCGKYAGQTIELHPFHEAPYKPKSSALKHPIVADWARGIEFMSNRQDDGSNGLHALHVLNIMEKAALSSKNNGQRVQLGTSSGDLHLDFNNCFPRNFVLKEKSLSNCVLSSITLPTIYPIIYGTMHLCTCKEPLKLLDTAFNLGINAYDLATVYGTKVEMIFGKWLESRRCCSNKDLGNPGIRNNGFIQRKDLFLIGKGGHPYHLSRAKARLLAEDIRKDITSSLANLKCAYFNLYLLHRDDPEEFPDLSSIVIYMNDFIQEGLLLDWGTSNWTKDRIEEAIIIAHNLKLKPPIVESSQFSLAVPEKELWQNAKSVGKGFVDNNSARPLHIEQRVKDHTYFTWASLAEGFLASKEYFPKNKSRSEVWQTELNLRRKGRLLHFAEQRSITLAQASLMYSYYFSHGIILGTKEICHLQEAADAIAYFTGTKCMKTSKLLNI